MRRVQAAAAVVFVLPLSTAGCSSVPHTTNVGLPPGPEVVNVTMREFAFDLDRPVPTGRVVFRVANHGRVAHSLTVIPIPDDLPPLDAQLHGDSRQVTSPFAGIPSQGPGASDSFAVDIQPHQRYGFICLLRDPDGSSHALKGMNLEFKGVEAGRAS